MKKRRQRKQKNKKHQVIRNKYKNKTNYQEKTVGKFNKISAVFLCIFLRAFEEIWQIEQKL